MCPNVFARTFLYRFFSPATRFLHENGVLLHYNDQLRGLNHLYFIDPAWVCDLIATLVTIRERNPFIVDGVMKMKDLELVLRDPKFPEEFIPQVMFISRLKLRSICHWFPEYDLLKTNKDIALISYPDLLLTKPKARSGHVITCQECDRR